MLLGRWLKVTLVVLLFTGFGLLYISWTAVVSHPREHKETKEILASFSQQLLNDNPPPRKRIRKVKRVGYQIGDLNNRGLHVIDANQISKSKYTTLTTSIKPTVQNIDPELNKVLSQSSPKFPKQTKLESRKHDQVYSDHTVTHAVYRKKLDAQSAEKASQLDKSRRHRTENLQIKSYNTTICQKQKHLCFIKVHKTGSSTVSSVFFRFGVKNNLTFVLPSDDVIITFMQESSWSNILAPPPGKRYEILCSHSVYVKSKARNLLPTDTFFTAIIREPLSHLRSVIHYFYEKKISGKWKVKKFLTNPYQYKNFMFNNMRSFTNNSMSYELGLAPENFNNKTKISTFLETIDKEFGLILIMEDMEESLILLKRYLCWELSDILFIRRNVNMFKPETEKVSKKLLSTHRRINMADYMLYEYFSKRFNERIEDEGDDFVQEVKFYRTVLLELTKLCYALHDPRRMSITIEKSKWNRSFNISFEDCKIFLYNGNEILYYAKHYQYPDLF